MAGKALIEQRPWLLASVASAATYYFLWNNPIAGLWLILLKGAGVGLLAVYAMRRTSGFDGAILVLALALAAAGDMAIELDRAIGGALFLAAHCVAVALYVRNRRRRITVSQGALAIVLIVATPLISWLLSGRLDVTIYSVSLGAMAGAAWASRFPRYRVGTGAVLFVISDWLLFSRDGGFHVGVLPDLLIWPLYYAGQLMIATGVVQTLRGGRPVR